MKTTKTALFLSLLSFSLISQATDYSDRQKYRDYSSKSEAQHYQLNHTVCYESAKMAVTAWNMKVKGEPQPHDTPDTYMYPMNEWAMDYGYNHAINGEDAVYRVYAKCQDNIDDLVIGFRDTKKIQKTLNY